MLLFVLPDASAPWTAVRDLLAAAAEGGWKNLRLAATDPAAGGALRLVPVAVPSGAGPVTGVDPVVVRIEAGGGYQAADSEHDTAASLEKWARERHAENEDFTKGYSSTAESTAWSLDGAGGNVGGVLAALDALHAAGVVTVRIEGVKGPAPK